MPVDLTTLISRTLLLFCLFTAPLAAAQSCKPLETREANVPEQRPAFPGQTRACGEQSQVPFDVTVLARGLEKPWAVEPLPDGTVLLTEKEGRMRIVSAKGELGAPIAGLPQVDARGQGGLLDVALSPKFESDRTIFWSFAEPREGGNGTSVARGTLAQNALNDVRVIFRAQPTYRGTMHYGSRLAFGPDGMLYISTGERSDEPMRKYSQDPKSHLGKIVRSRPTARARRSSASAIATCRRWRSMHKAAYGSWSTAREAATS